MSLYIRSARVRKYAYNTNYEKENPKPNECHPNNIALFPIDTNYIDRGESEEKIIMVRPVNMKEKQSTAISRADHIRWRPMTMTGHSSKPATATQPSSIITQHIMYYIIFLFLLLYRANQQKNGKMNELDQEPNLNTTRCSRYSNEVSVVYCGGVRRSLS